MPEGTVRELSVLIVDDTAETRALLKMQLESVEDWSLVIELAETGEEGLEKLKKASFDIIFLDYALPGADGLEILSRIRQLYPQVPVVMVTSAGSEEVAARAVKLGALNYIPRSEMVTAKMSHIFSRAFEMRFISRENADLKKASEVQDRILSNISHEMRTPLAVVLGYAESLRDGVLGPLAEGQVKAVEAIIARAATLKETLDRILRVKGGAPAAKTAQRIDLRELLAAGIGRFEREAKAKRMTFKAALPASEVWVQGSPEEFSHVAVSLFSNAVRYGSEGSDIRVTLSCEEPAQVFLKVENDGPGLAPEMLPHVFETFGASTARNSVTPAGGLGLGLPLSRRIIEASGGKIWLESSPGHGAKACVILPAAPAAPPLPRGEGSRPDGNGERAAAPGAKRILIVEDDAELAGVLKLVLSSGLKEVLEFEVARTGLEALQRVQFYGPDLMILDLLMPDGDGFEVLSRLAKLSRPPAVLVLTGRSEAAAKAKALGAGAVLLKPVGKKMLLDSITDLLNKGA